MVISKDLDKVAREKAETVIRVSQLAILIFFPLFFAVGIGMLFFITANVVRRLMLLITVVEKTGKGSYPHLTVAPSDGRARDEVGVLIEKFNDMEDQLALREQELGRKNQELMQAKKLAAIGTLASGVAHELNNPLNNIYLSAQALTREAGERCSLEVKEAVGDIVGQTERVKRIVSDLLEFARGREPQYQDVDLCGLITDAYRHAASSRDLSRIRYVCSSDPLRIIASLDQGQMEQVFTNLFMNAADAMQAKGEITVTARQKAQDVVIRVSDSGRGIPRESQDKIFEPFFTTKEQGKGTGLGLSMVFGIVKNHGGFIDVETEPGRGTTFRTHFPASGGARARQHSDARPPLLLGSGKGKVLLVDDQEAVRDVCGAMLMTLGYEVVTASDGLEGVDRYQGLWREIDLVIVDMIMPAMGGREAFRRMKEINPGIRAILSTGYSMEGAVQEIMEEGMLGFIQKPYRLDQLADAILRALNAVVE